jgi:hypothetical protein
VVTTCVCNQKCYLLMSQRCIILLIVGIEVLSALEWNGTNRTHDRVSIVEISLMDDDFDNGSSGLDE